MRIGVVTRIAPPSEAGNLAVEVPIVEVESPDSSNGWKGVYQPITGAGILAFRSPLFRVGEVLISDGEDGRDQFGRNPSKWDVSVKWFDLVDGTDVSDVVARVIEVVESATREEAPMR